MENNCWEEIHQKKEWGKYPTESIIRFVAKYYYSVLDRKTIKILEIGCGTGSNIWYCAKEGFEIHGIDISETAVKKCVKRLNEEVPQWVGKINTGNLLNIGYENEYFDAIIDNECLSCNSLDKTKVILKEIKRVLKPNGRFISVGFTTTSKIGLSNNKMDTKNIAPINGPLSGNGTIRLIDEEDINSLYTSFFNINSFEILQKTIENRKYNIVEYVIDTIK